MVTKKLSIHKAKCIEGGSLSYAAAASGLIHYAVSLSYSFFGHHTFSTSGDYQVDPHLLESAKVHVGQVISIGPVTLFVKSIVGKVAHAHVEVKGYGQGDLTVSLAKPIIEPLSLEADFHYIVSDRLVAA